MTQPTERRFIMEPRLDAEVETLNLAIDAEETARIAGDALKVAKAGDTMTGALVLSGDPTLAMHAATKQYVDAADAAIQASITTAGETSRIYVKNGTTALTKGTPVYITGADGTNVIVGAAGNGSEATSSKTIGLLQQDLAINAMGYAVIEGKLTNIDTSAAGAAGDAVWLGPNGTKLYGLANKPVAPAHMVYLGVVAKKNASTGEISVHIQNGFELDELHNVLITSPVNGQALTYDNATGLWKNATPVSSLAGLSDVTITAPAAGQSIKYDGAKWVNLAGGSGGIAVTDTPSLSALQGDGLMYATDGTLFVRMNDNLGNAAWVEPSASIAAEAVGYGVVKLNQQIMTGNYTMPSGYNGMSAGPITIASGVTVTIPDGSAWSIV